MSENGSAGRGDGEVESWPFEEVALSQTIPLPETVIPRTMMQAMIRGIRRERFMDITFLTSPLAA